MATVTHPRAESRTGLGRGCVATPGAYVVSPARNAHRHVWVAVGRDYADVPPLKDMTRLA
ncbi:hypothetical protein GCM10009609_73160 [Pseudonocardia aurantiaca]